MITAWMIFKWQYKKSRLFTLALVFFLSVTSLSAFTQQQALRFSHIATTDGLPYCSIIKMFTASDNMVWISTSEGLYYFDGKKIKQFNSPGGAEFFGGWTNYITAGKTGNLYVGSVKGLLCINSTFLTSNVPALYKVKDHFQPFYTEPLCEDVNGNLWLYTGYNSGSLAKLNVQDNSLQVVINDINGVMSVIKNKRQKNPVGIWYRENRGAYYLSLTDNKAQITDQFYTGKNSFNPPLYVNDVIATDTSEAWIATIQGLYYVNRKTKKQKLCNLGQAGITTNIKSLAYRKNGLIYCGTGKDGILVYDPVRDEIIARHKHYDQDLWSIAGNNVEYIYIDEQERLFVATANQGISYASLTDATQVYHKLRKDEIEPAISFNEKITAITIKKDFYYSYVEEKGLFITDKDFTVLKTVSNSITGKINHLFANNTDTVWAATDKGLFYILGTSIMPVSVASETGAPRMFKVATLDKKIIAAGDVGIYFVETNKDRLILKNYIITPKIAYPFFLDLFEYKPGNFLLNTKYTSFFTTTIQNDTIHVNTEIRAVDIVPLNYKNISDIEILVCCTKGIYILNTQANTLTAIVKESADPYCSFFYEGDHIYALSSNYICRFTLDKKNKSVLISGMQKIIPGVFSPAQKEYGTQWISGTSGGLVKFDVARKITPHYYIFAGTDSVKNTWHKLTSSDTLVLSLTDKKDLFVSANNFTGSTVQLYYKTSENDRWQSFPNGEMISLESLTGGWHTIFFNIFPIEDGSISKVIFIPTPWFKKWWAKLGALLLILVMLFLFARLMIRNVKKTAAVKQHIIETEMAALKAQMNPHFMFNCINCIDAFIHSNDKYNATLYLNKFAKLLRNILDSSKQNTVAFTKDVETLKLYIELEELRHENKFKTNINIDDELLSNDYKVPPLIIQPFVENAILHGLKNREENEGLLEIKIEKVADKIKYSIKDNGIGRKAASAIAQNKEASYGMQMSNDRIKLFNKEEKPSVQIIDLYKNDFAVGTEVKICLNII